MLKTNTLDFSEAVPASLNNVVDLLLDAVCVVDRTGFFVFVSAACEPIFGYKPHEMIGRPMIDLVHPDDQARTLESASEVMAGNHRIGFENRYIRKDGQVAHIQWSARWSECDQLRIAVARDITQRKRTESLQSALYAISEAAHAVDDQQALFERIHQITNELLPATNFAIAFYNEHSGEISFPYRVNGQQPSPEPEALDASALCAEVIRRGDTLLLTPDAEVDLPETLRQVIRKTSLSWLGVPLKSNSGTLGALMVQSDSPELRYTESDSELLQFISRQIADAIERKQMLARLQHIALYDQLTKLPNRELFYDRIQSALARARREQGQLALLYLDLDRFKEVNDTFGHATGDLLLENTAQRILQCVRESDTVVRFGGDEFVILLENVDSEESASMVAGKIRDALNQPFTVKKRSIHILPSIGIAIFPQHGQDEKELLHHADEAMYLAKQSGGNGFQVNCRQPIKTSL